ncbi:hypothetical protein A2J05_02620 [Fusobacterium necrophorum subsp. funduliforme]|uniref:type VI-C CRISPR-associated RNA-guided ribonuclease Cas13c n=1 Tax=Fusobacterium necrophorum TaxID=859 RepID=UPI0007881064|nr:type VI-C CRISPR-associated RNA-guided ribonuclease Cas13c [Fusobacterium necrophorum]KYL01414.1 hypothetical protein A2J05_02620 [Fusobacterium necrophorum subsp. funduliforme]
MEKFRRQNRNSIIKIIISNYDTKGIKELKVRYRKQAQLDTFIIKTEIVNNDIFIKSIIEKAREKYRYSFLFDGEEKYHFKNKSSVEIVKKDIFSQTPDNMIRNYKITLKISEKNPRVVEAEIEDLMNSTILKDGRRSARREKSVTERKLIEEKVAENYSLLANCPMEEVDSIKIYKIKRFLTYRSNMLLYFASINSFLCEGIKGKENETEEIWHLKDNDVRKEKVKENFKNKLIQSTENYNSSLKNQIEEKEKLLRKESKKGAFYRTIIKKLQQERIKELSEKSLTEDCEKIIKLYSKLRHSLMHYDYQYFENLFENKETPELKDKLDLHLFKSLPLIRKMKLNNKVNYLEDGDTLFVLQKTKKAKTLYQIYDALCEQKNGFNKFINDFFVSDGEENTVFKQIINEKFQSEMEFLGKRISESEEKNPKLKKKFDSMKAHFHNINSEDTKEAYFWDIHSSSNYKTKYNERKNLVNEYTELLGSSKEKKLLREEITQINRKLLKLKQEMEEITKKNSLFRLEYKMKMAFGFLFCEFDGNISRFKDEFDASNQEKIIQYHKNGEKYLTYFLKEEEKEKFNLKKLQETIQKTGKENWLLPQNKNNLFKFYLLTYLLLPYELKGDFLGFVKKHYYDIKNVDFMDENQSSKIIESKEDDFYHKIRLFEKNTKKYEIVKYSIVPDEKLKQYFKDLGIDTKYLILEQKSEVSGEKNKKVSLKNNGMFNKTILLFVFKYYQIAFKLFNDIELYSLFFLREKSGKPFEVFLKELKDKMIGKQLNFGQLLYVIYEVLVKNKDLSEILSERIDYRKDMCFSAEIADLRNFLSHLNYSKFLDNFMKINTNKSDENKEVLIPSIKIQKMIKFIEECNLQSQIDFDFNFVNDFYMRKEKMFFIQLKQIFPDINSTEKQKMNEKEEILRNRYHLTDKKNEQIKDEHEAQSQLYEKILSLQKIYSSDKNNFYGRLKEEKLLFLGKQGKKKLSMEEIKDKIAGDISDLLGILKKEITRDIKDKLTEKFRYCEEKLLNLSFYNHQDKKKEESIRVFLIRDKNSDNFKFESILDDGSNKIFISKNGKEITIQCCDKVLETLMIEKNTLKISSNGKIISLVPHYSYSIDVKY